MKVVALRLCIVLIPSYAAAYFTGEMVWVVPTLVGSEVIPALKED